MNEIYIVTYQRPNGEVVCLTAYEALSRAKMVCSGVAREYGQDDRLRWTWDAQERCHVAKNRFLTFRIHHRILNGVED